MPNLTTIPTLLGYDQYQIRALTTWLWQRGPTPLTPADLACDLAIDPPLADLTCRLLRRVGVLQETETGQRAQVDITRLLLVQNISNHLFNGSGTLCGEPLQVGLTLPSDLEIPAALVGQPSIAQLINAVIQAAQERLWIASPQLDDAGLEHIIEPLQAARQRGVKLMLLTDTSPNQRQAIERLRQMQADQMRLFSVGAVDEFHCLHLLLKTGLVIADGRQGYIGSAYLTKMGLGDGVEIGLGLAGMVVSRLEHGLQQLVADRWAEPVSLN